MPSVTHVAICMSRAFCSMDERKRETARSLPASQMHTNRPKRKIAHGMGAAGRENRRSYRYKDVFVEYPVRVISVAVIVVVVEQCMFILVHLSFT